MRYIAIKRFKRNSINGYANIPYGSVLEKRDDGMLYFDGKPVVVARSMAAHEYFARDDDGAGLKRGELTRTILSLLAPQDGETRWNRGERWKPIWSDPLAQSYRKPEHKDYWLWSDDFFNASVEDLRHIAALACAGKGK